MRCFTGRAGATHRGRNTATHSPWRIDIGKFALSSTQIVEVPALDRCSQNFKIQILRRGAHRFQKGDAMMLHLRDGGRLVPRGVVDAE